MAPGIIQAQRRSKRSVISKVRELTGLQLAPRKASTLVVKAPRSVKPHHLTPHKQVKPTPEPLWLKQLHWWRQVTTGLAVVSCGAVVAFYSWTVYTQHYWNQQYSALDRMKRNELQSMLTLQSILLSLRNDAARSEMVPLVPERLIEVPIIEVTADEPTQPTPPDQRFYPVGY